MVVSVPHIEVCIAVVRGFVPEMVFVLVVGRVGQMDVPEVKALRPRMMIGQFMPMGRDGPIAEHQRKGTTAQREDPVHLSQSSRIHESPLITVRASIDILWSSRVDRPLLPTWGTASDMISPRMQFPECMSRQRRERLGGMLKFHCPAA